MRSDKLYLVDLIDASQAIAEFIAEMEATQFFRDHKTQSAVLQQKFTN